MKNIKISVIVPVYNVEKYIDKCVESILRQTHENFEVILVNDGSTDSSYEHLVKYLYDERVRIIDKPNSGQSDSRYKGLLIAEGDYVYYVDSDDFIEPYTLESLVYQIEKTDADIVFGRYRLVDEYGNTIREQKKYSVKLLEGTSVILSDAICVTNFKASLCLKLIRKSLLMKSYIKDILGIHLNEDVFLSIILASNCKKVIFINDIIYNVLQRGDSLTRSLKPELITSNEKIFCYVMNYLKNKGFWELCKNEFYNGYLKTILYVLALVAVKSVSFNEYYLFYKFLPINSLYYSQELNNHKHVLGTFRKTLFYISHYPRIYYILIKLFKPLLKY